MLYPLQVSASLLALLLGGTGLFLSLWIVIPAPTGFWLVLGIGAPEVSPWLLVLNLVAGLLALVGVRSSQWQRLALTASLAGLLLSALPLVQLPQTEQELAAAMQTGLGIDYQAQISSPAKAQMRPQPFVLADGFSGIKLGQVRCTTGIPFATPDNLRLTLNVYQPPDSPFHRGRASPAIVVLYSGAWQSGSPAQNSEFNRYMAARGYTVFAISYRHAPRYRFPSQLEDVQAALVFIRQYASQYGADPDRIALLGRSAGAHLAMLAAYQPGASPVRAVVNYYGPVDLAAGYADPPRPDPLNVRALLEAFLGGPPEKLMARYQAASPINFVTQPLPPTLLVYGSRDHVVQSKYGRRLYNRLRSVRSTAVLLEIPWAEHAFDTVFNGPSNQLALYYTERFLAWALR